MDSARSSTEPRDAPLARILAPTEALVRIASSTGDEHEVAEWLVRELAPLRPHALIRAANSVCVVPRAPRPGAKTLLLAGHTDTVPKLGENPVRREGDKLYGLGASDMKAALAVMLEACERARDAAPRQDLVCVFYGGEEGAYTESEMPAIVAAAQPWFDRTELAICMEPTDGQIQLGCLGTAHAEVTFRGKRAHSARPWQGEMRSTRPRACSRASRCGNRSTTASTACSSAKWSRRRSPRARARASVTRNAASAAGAGLPPRARARSCGRGRRS